MQGQVLGGLALRADGAAPEQQVKARLLRRIALGAELLFDLIGGFGDLWQGAVARGFLA